MSNRARKLLEDGASAVEGLDQVTSRHLLRNFAMLELRQTYRVHAGL
ncbi:hypothetical protein [Bradyrhizobium sp. F1.13.3]